MCSLKSKSVLGQTLFLICFLVALLVVEPELAQCEVELDSAHPNLVEKITLASIKIDTATKYISQVVEIPILIRNDVAFGGFELEVDYPYVDLTLLEVRRGEALSDTSNGENDWEYFSYRILPCPSCPSPYYKCLLYGLSDIPNEHVGVPLAPNSEYVSLAVLKFMIANGGFPSGTLLPIIFEWEGTVVNDTVIEDWDCAENTFTDTSSDTLYTSQNPAQFNPFLCPPANPSLEFLDGGVFAFYPSETRGDINLDSISYTVPDWVLFQSFLVYGDSILIDPSQQATNSDVNCDSLPWSIADLLYMFRVMLHESPELLCKDQEMALSEFGSRGLEHFTNWRDITDQLTLVSSSTHPGEVVSVPVWLSNSIIAGGITFNVVFDSALLSVDGVDTAQTRISGWQNINPVINPRELFFFGFPDWWQAPPFPGISPGEGTLIKISFQVDNSVPPGTFLPITFQAEPNLGHYNAYADTIGITFIQPPTTSGWIFTDVIAGDANSDGIVNLGDLVYLINYLYKSGQPPSPLSLGDFKPDGEVNLGDVVALINYLYHS